MVNDPPSIGFSGTEEDALSDSDAFLFSKEIQDTHKAVVDLIKIRKLTEIFTRNLEILEETETSARASVPNSTTGLDVKLPESKIIRKQTMEEEAETHVEVLALKSTTERSVELLLRPVLPFLPPHSATRTTEWLLSLIRPSLLAGHQRITWTCVSVDQVAGIC